MLGRTPKEFRERSCPQQQNLILFYEGPSAAAFCTLQLLGALNVAPAVHTENENETLFALASGMRMERGGGGRSPFVGGGGRG